MLKTLLFLFAAGCAYSAGFLPVNSAVPEQTREYLSRSCLLCMAHQGAARLLHCSNLINDMAGFWELLCTAGLSVQ
jgi:hypothetical protein